MQTRSESRTFSTKVKFNQKVIAKKETSLKNLGTDQYISNMEAKKCDELSPVVLNDILGAAFNSRCVLVLNVKFGLFSQILKDSHEKYLRF